MRFFYAGEIKRWNHHRGPMSHGSKSHRLHGSTGASATPNRTFPGQKMSGHMGDKRVKCRKLKVRPLQPCQMTIPLPLTCTSDCSPSAMLTSSPHPCSRESRKTCITHVAVGNVDSACRCQHTYGGSPGCVPLVTDA